MDSSKWLYRSEGNAGIVISNKQGALRLTKQLVKDIENGKFELNSDSLIDRQLDFVSNVVLPSIPCDFIVPMQKVFLPPGFIRDVSKQIQPLRPAHRLEKSLSSSLTRAVLMPDLCLMPSIMLYSHHKAAFNRTKSIFNDSNFYGEYCTNKLDEKVVYDGFLGNNKNDEDEDFNEFDDCDDTLTVEIKPKWGFLPEAEEDEDVKKKVCRFCMHQIEKLYTGKYKQRSLFCPIDFFSGCKQRMYFSIRSLLENPQNNCKVFMNGKVILTDLDSGCFHKQLNHWFKTNCTPKNNINVNLSNDTNINVNDNVYVIYNNRFESKLAKDEDDEEDENEDNDDEDDDLGSLQQVKKKRMKKKVRTAVDYLVKLLVTCLLHPKPQNGHEGLSTTTTTIIPKKNASSSRVVENSTGGSDTCYDSGVCVAGYDEGLSDVSDGHDDDSTDSAIESVESFGFNHNNNFYSDDKKSLEEGWKRVIAGQICAESKFQQQHVLKDFQRNKYHMTQLKMQRTLEKKLQLLSITLTSKGSAETSLKSYSISSPKQLSPTFSLLPHSSSHHKTLPATCVLSSLLACQSFDINLSISYILECFQAVNDFFLKHPGAREACHVDGPYGSDWLHHCPYPQLSTPLYHIKRFLLARSLKDSSIIISLISARKYKPRPKNQCSLWFVGDNKEIMAHVTIIDMDVKSFDKIPYYYSEDESIVKCYLDTKSKGGWKEGL